MMDRAAFYVWALLALAIGGAGAARADTFDFSYAGSGVSAMGTLTATLQSPGRYLVTGITGERNNIPITALLAPAAFNGNDNILKYPANPGYFDNGGVSYSAGSTNSNVYYSNGDYFELISDSTSMPLTSFTVTAEGAPAPVPGGGLLSFLALGLVGLIWRRKVITAFRQSNCPGDATC